MEIYHRVLTCCPSPSPCISPFSSPWIWRSPPSPPNLARRGRRAEAEKRSNESVQVKLELGHRATHRKKPTADGFTHDWLVFVRGPEGSNIQNFVEKVVFHLHESFPKPKRVVKDPPYQVSETGYAGFTLPIDIYFKNKEEPKKIRFSYDLFLHLDGSPPVNHIRCEKLTFQNPTEEFRRKLLKAGGVGVPGPNEHSTPGPQQSLATKTTTPAPPAVSAAAPQTPESQVFADLFGAPLKADSHRSKHKSHSASKDKSSKPKSGGSANSTPSHTGSVGTPTGPPPPFPGTPSKDQHKAASGGPVPVPPTLHPTIASKDKSASLAREKERDREKSSKDREKEREKEKFAQKRLADTSPSAIENAKKKRKESSRGDDGKREREEGKEDKKEGKSRDKDRDRDKEKSKSRSKEKDRESKSSHKSKKDRDRDGDHRSRHDREKEKYREREKEKSESNSIKPNVAIPVSASVTKSVDQAKVAAPSGSLSGGKPAAELSKAKLPPRELVELPPFEEELSTGELSDFDFVDPDDIGNKSPLSSLSPSSMKGSGGALSSLMAEITNEFDDDEDMLSPLHESSPPALFSQNNARPRSATPQSDKGSQPPKLDAAHDSPSPHKSKKRDKEKKERKSKEHKENKERNSKESKENHDSTTTKELEKEPVKIPSPVVNSITVPMETKDMGTSLLDSDIGNKMDGVESVVDINGQNKAPNGEFFSVLLQLQHQLMTITDRDLLKRVVNVIEETGLYKITDATFDFDLCCLDTNTVRKIQTCLELTS